MSNTSNSSDEQENVWLSAFLLIFGLGSVVIAALAFIGGSLLPGLLAMGVAILFFALRRIIDQQQATAHRLRQIESELASRRGGSA
jgi:uncharacterized paraquat-inducible protein A